MSPWSTAGEAGRKRALRGSPRVGRLGRPNPVSPPKLQIRRVIVCLFNRPLSHSMVCSAHLQQHLRQRKAPAGEEVGVPLLQVHRQALDEQARDGEGQEQLRSGGGVSKEG